jgi:hypothetical protein
MLEAQMWSLAVATNGEAAVRSNLFRELTADEMSAVSGGLSWQKFKVLVGQLVVDLITAVAEFVEGLFDQAIAAAREMFGMEAQVEPESAPSSS